MKRTILVLVVSAALAITRLLNADPIPTKGIVTYTVPATQSAPAYSLTVNWATRTGNWVDANGRTARMTGITIHRDNTVSMKMTGKVHYEGVSGDFDYVTDAGVNHHFKDLGNGWYQWSAAASHIPVK